MPEDVINLDELGGPAKKVILDGQEFILPGDLPIDLYIEMAEAERRFEDEDADDLAILKSLRDRVLELFQFHQPDLQELPRSAGFRQILQLVGTVYRSGGGDTDEQAALEAAEEDRPTRRSSRKTGSKGKTAAAAASDS
jgi:hypothetical protein